MSGRSLNDFEIIALMGDAEIEQGAPSYHMGIFCGVAALVAAGMLGYNICSSQHTNQNTEKPPVSYKSSVLKAQKEAIDYPDMSRIIPNSMTLKP